MKITEIVIDQHRNIFDKFANNEVTSRLIKLYTDMEDISNEFTIPASTLFTPYGVNEELTDLYDIKDMVAVFQHDSQMPDLIRTLIHYFEKG